MRARISKDFSKQINRLSISELRELIIQARTIKKTKNLIVFREKQLLTSARKAARNMAQIAKEFEFATRAGDKVSEEARDEFHRILSTISPEHIRTYAQKVDYRLIKGVKAKDTIEEVTDPLYEQVKFEGEEVSEVKETLETPTILSMV